MTTFDKNEALIRLSESAGADFGRVAFDAQSAPQKVFSAIWQLESLVNIGTHQSPSVPQWHTRSLRSPRI